MRTSANNPSSSDPNSARFGQRIQCELPVGLEIDGREPARGIIRNASISGALIETAPELEPHTNLVVTLTVSSGGVPVTRSLNACVVRVDPAGCAVEWRDMACADITDLLERASG